MLVLYHIGVACKQGLVCLKIAGCPQQMAGWSQAVEWEEKQSHLAHSGPLPSHPPPAPQVRQHALWRRIFCRMILGSLEVVWPPAEWTSVVLWSLLQLEAGSGHADKIVSTVRDD